MLFPMRLPPFFFTALLYSLAACGHPQPSFAPTPGSVATARTVAPGNDAPLPLYERVHKGTLPSGLTYFVLAHQKPEHRAQMWLAVNAGSVLEDDDQRGLAHFVEHMGFKGTRRFPKQALVDFLEKSGVSFGADLNANTSFDQTVYMLQVPTDQPPLVSRAIDILRDWSDGMTFDPAEVDAERGVVLEEWRLRRGARMRLFDKQAPALFHGSKYAERITIGNPEVIRGAARDTLVRFYKDWYRPDLMAVVAVGDFDPADIEAEIKREFASLAPSAAPRPSPAVTLPPHAEPLVSIETDPEATSTSVSLLTQLPHRPEVTRSDYRRKVSESLYATMLNARLDEVRRRPDAPFLSAGVSAASFVRTADSFTQTATVKEDGVREGLAALVEEQLRVERHGFTLSELQRARLHTLNWFERFVREYEKSDSHRLASEIVRNFLTNEAMPGPEGELALVREFLPTYTLAELNGIGAALSKGSRVLLISGPATMMKPSAATVLATTKEVESRDILPYDDATPTAPLMASKPLPGRVVQARTIAELGVTEWTLANGVRVVVKPTDFKNDDIRVSAFALGGTSLASDVDYDSAIFASSVVGQGGIGALDAVALRKALTGKAASATAHIGETEQGLTGATAPGDFETMLQVIHLMFTAPRRDEGGFQAWRTREIERAKDRLLSPEASFRDELMVVASQNHRRRQSTTPATIEKVNLDKALAFYKSSFADASAFTFVLVGNLDLDRTKGLLEVYLGSLPSTHRKETWRDIHVRPPKGVVRKVVTKGSEPKSAVLLMFHGDAPWSRDAQNDMQMLGEVLRIRLREVLREDMSGVYGVSAGGWIARRPRQEYAFTVSFGCAPENVEKLEAAVWDEVKTIQDHAVGEDVLAKVKEQRRRGHEVSLRDNGWWLRELQQAYDYGDDPKTILEFESQVDKVSSDRVRAAARKYLTSAQYVLGELQPATAAAKP
jgi:zinc protease